LTVELGAAATHSGSICGGCAHERIDLVAWRSRLGEGFAQLRLVVLTVSETGTDQERSY
jgi:hypothetical protein